MTRVAGCSFCGGAPPAPAMGSEDYYLELCERPVQFEKANPVNCVFFDEANKQVSEGPAPRRLGVRTLAESARCSVPEQRRGCECMGGATVQAACQTVSLRVWPALALS